MTNLSVKPNSSEIVLYQTEDGKTRIQVHFEGETAWLTQNQMAELFQTSIPNISMHVRNIFREGELTEDSVVKEFLTTAADGKKYKTRHFNLDVIISVGYRVKSHRGTQFRIWATQRLREYIVKGFTLDDERLKQAGGGNYFDELLARIRDIRASEKVFWRKVLDIYATSIDYDPNTETSRRFFQVVQNKMHWAAHGHTAAEIIAGRADAQKPNMGLTSWTGARPTQEDIEVAKNYLSAEELDTLNRIVTIYLDFAELQALSRRPMYMKDWIAKLDDFLRASEREVLAHVGRVSHEAAIEKAHIEYEKYRQKMLAAQTTVERHFIETIRELEAMEKPKPVKAKRPRKRKDEK